jgi:hypothetical protein
LLHDDLTVFHRRLRFDPRHRDDCCFGMVDDRPADQIVLAVAADVAQRDRAAF